MTNTGRPPLVQRGYSSHTNRGYAHEPPQLHNQPQHQELIIQRQSQGNQNLCRQQLPQINNDGVAIDESSKHDDGGDDDEEEGEIDEEEEDLAQLYDEFEEPNTTNSALTKHFDSSEPDADSRQNIEIKYRKNKIEEERVEHGKENEGFDRQESESSSSVTATTKLREHINKNSKEPETGTEESNHYGTLENNASKIMTAHETANDDSDFDDMFGGEENDDADSIEKDQVNSNDSTETNGIMTQQHQPHESMRKVEHNIYFDRGLDESTKVANQHDERIEMKSEGDDQIDDDVMDMFGNSSDEEEDDDRIIKASTEEGDGPHANIETVGVTEVENTETSSFEKDDELEMFGDSSDDDDNDATGKDSHYVSSSSALPQHISLKNEMTEAPLFVIDRDPVKLDAEITEETKHKGKDASGGSTITYQSIADTRRQSLEKESTEVPLFVIDREPVVSSACTTKEMKEKDNDSSSGPMTAAQAIAAARHRASIPKVDRQNKAPTAKPPALSRIPPKNQSWPSQKNTSLPPKVPESIMPTSRSDPPKRTYYQSVHPDKYWSQLRNWDFVREMNDTIKNNNSSSQNKNQGSKKRKSNEGADCESGAKATAKENLSDGFSQTLPDAFDSVSQYKALWAPLLLNEAKAQIMSEVVAAQSSPSTSWMQRTQITMGAVVKLEIARTAKDLSSSRDNISGTSNEAKFTAFMEPTVALVVKNKGAGIGCPVCTNDLLLFVRQPTTIELALRGKAFDALDAAAEKSVGMRKLPQGRLGVIGHALNSRTRSIDGLLVRVSQKLWSQFSSLDEVFVIRIGSNVTALREFNALSRADSIPLTKYLLDGNMANKGSTTELSTHLGTQTSTTSSTNPATHFDPLAASGNSLPVGFRIFIKSKMNDSQLHAITAAAREYGDGGFTLIKGPPGTGKSTTLVSVLNALHLRQYQEYYAAIERIVTESNVNTYYEELAALNKAAEVKPRILVCAPSNAAIDNVIVKIMNDRFVDGNGAKYAPSIVRVGAGIVNSKVKPVGLKEMVDSIIAYGADVTTLESIISSGRQKLRRIQKEIQKLKVRIQSIVNACPYDICADWEIRIDEASFESTGSVLFVNHKTQKTTYDLPMPVRPTEMPCQINKMPHYVELLKSITKYVERFNIESSNLEKYIIIQNAANARMEGGGSNFNELTLTQELETHVLNSNHIILTTLGSSGSRVVESANKFEVVVIDEAAQSSEPSTLVALQLGSSHAILVGDPQQLPATIFSVSGRNTKYDRSLFQRLEESGHPVHMLNTQYRMHPVISAFPRHIFYDGMLLDGSNVQSPTFGGSLNSSIRNKFPHFQPFNILDLDSKEERDGTSLSNMDEAQLVLHLYRAIDHETDGMLAKTRVAVITPYSQQSNLLQRLFENAYGVTYATRVEISTVDAFQGREAGIVIYSCVRAGGCGSGIGFLSDVQRMNVALTRAKHFLFIIARRRSIMVNPYWRKLVGYARERSSIIHVPLDRQKYRSNANNNERDIIFPNLTRLAPVHKTSDMGVMSDSEYSA